MDKAGRHGWIVVSALLSGLAGPGFAATQTLVEPSAFESDLLRQRSFFEYGGFEPDLDQLLPTGSVSQWSLNVGVAGDYTDNVDQDQVGRDAFSADGELGVGWLRQSPRFTGSADYSLSTALYESDAAENQNGTTQAVAGALKWQALQYLNLDASGYVTQNVERGLAPALPGVGTGYRNREDEYGARAGAFWRISRGLSNQTSYAFSYRNYLSDEADGADTRTHQGDTRFTWQAAARDSMAVGYSYTHEDEVGSPLLRRNHLGTASWVHALTGGFGSKPADVTLFYAADRGLEEDSDDVEGGQDYWSHKGDLAYSVALSPRSDARVNGGYQWIRPDDGEIQRGWNYGARMGHRFSERTNGSIAFRQDWDYEPVSARTDFTQLTRLWEFQGELSSGLTRTVSGRLSGSYLNADASEELAGGGAEDYWEAGGAASLSGRLGEKGFWGIGYRLTRRQADPSDDDDYFLQAGNVFLRQQVLSWLRARLSYLHERRDHDSTSPSDSYHENRVNFALTVTL